MDLDLLVAYGPKLLIGVWVTLTLVLLAVPLGFALALPMALARNSQILPLRWFAKCYIIFFRGTPLLGQLFLIYYGAGELRPQLTELGIWWIFRDPWLCAFLAFTMNTMAYQAEILRGALSSLPIGQSDAIKALGLPRGTSFFVVLLPQALIVALRPLGNEFILTLKASALASVITVPELMLATKVAFSRSFDIQIYFWAAIIYLILVDVIRRFWMVLERILTRHLPQTAAT
jgi:polar amino acid transport system permease protein